MWRQKLTISKKIWNLKSENLFFFRKNLKFCKSWKFWENLKIWKNENFRNVWKNLKILKNISNISKIEVFFPKSEFQVFVFHFSSKKICFQDFEDKIFWALLRVYTSLLWFFSVPQYIIQICMVAYRRLHQKSSFYFLCLCNMCISLCLCNLHFRHIFSSHNTQSDFSYMIVWYLCRSYRTNL